MNAGRLIALAPRLAVINTVIVLDRQRECLNVTGRFVDEISLDCQPRVVNGRVANGRTRRHFDVLASLQLDRIGEYRLRSFGVRQRLKLKRLFKDLSVRAGDNHYEAEHEGRGKQP